MGAVKVEAQFPQTSSFGSGTFQRVAVRRVLTRPDPMLTLRAREVDPLAPAIVALADILVSTMRASPACCGLAATQIGELARVFVMDLTGHKKAKSCAGLVVVANPRIVAAAGECTMREGCMSVPDSTGDVVRASEVMIEGVEPGTGNLVRVTADAMEARCIQHELDHLDGRTFVDRVSDPARLFARKRYA